MHFGADVAGRVFKEISDRIYGRYLSTNNFSTTKVIDSSSDNSIGMKTDMQSIFSFLNINFKDSSGTGSWRNMQLKNNYASLNTPAYSVTPATVTTNVIGMGLKDAVYLLENKGLKIAILGSGKVTNQSIAAGTNFSKGQKIMITLN